MRIRHSRSTQLGPAIRRLGYICFVVVFTVAGAPNLSMSGLVSSAGTEHDAKPPISEEEIRIEHAIPESNRCRINRLHFSSCPSVVSSHTPQSGTRLLTLLDLSPRRVLDKLNGIGTFLLC
ncbi:MAG: hypothetical protein IPK83_19805 [Planctomycetes bacterium]|nr:hypothetical protein [Planctomycetota bacterium]